MATCRQCQTPYEFTEWEIDFLDRVSPTFAGVKFSLPAPALCPLCRAQQRTMWRGELHLFHRTCGLTGKKILTFFPPESDVTVYNVEDWFSDKWDGLDYGRDFDFSRPFFEQFSELISEVPLLALTSNLNENSDFINCASWCKNCYLLAGANHNEDCYYGNYVNHSKSCVDNNFIDSCELCYECVDCKNCYNLRYSDNCHQCTDSFFLANCRGCKHCFCSVNLVNKEYCYQNEQLSKEEYEKRISMLELQKRSSIAKCAAIFNDFRLKFPNRFRIGEMNENVTGNAIHNSRNSFNCFDASGLEDCHYCSWFHNGKDSMDIYSWGFPAELCYFCTEVGDNSYHSLFCVTSWNSQDIYYSFMSINNKNCFGCVSLQKKEHCIFNKQYSKDDYEALAGKIAAHMQETGEWGEFFPLHVSPLSYNTAVTNDYFPMERESVEAMGLRWHEESSDINADNATAPPDDISNTTEQCCSEVFCCERTGKPFKVIRQEFDFYARQGIPLPSLCFAERHKNRLARRNPRQLWDRNCNKCGGEIVTSFPPYQPDIVYCERCYQQEVY